MKPIKIKIFDHNGIFYNQENSIVTLKTPNGYRGIQQGALPVISTLVPSLLYIGRQNDTDRKVFEISDGVLYADANEVQIFVSNIKVVTTSKAMFEQ